MKRTCLVIEPKRYLATLILLMLWSGGATAATINSAATQCTFSNGAGRPWVQVTPLTSATPVGAVLWERPIGLNVNYSFGGSSGSVHHDLVVAAFWGPGTPLPVGIAPTNVAGIGFKVLVNSSDGVLRPVLQTVSPVAVEKEPVIYETTGGQHGAVLTTNYMQQLILTVKPGQLPSGKLVVERVDGSSQLTLYAVDLLSGVGALGGEIIIPTSNIPNGICRTPYLLMGPAIINMGGGGPVELPNKCLVEAYKTIPVHLGQFSLEKFPSKGSTSAPKAFAIELSQCAANAKPAITFSDKFGGGPDTSVLGLDPSPASAQGFGIVVTNELTREPIKYDGTAYVMQRVGDQARLPLTARYLRIGEDGQLKAGRADGAAEFTFSFP
ncbi:putative fimbrial protein [Pseudomonas orientalis]|uniref:fimbrial protein n=1 Tax=Pseudomonas orientalis TaxID=76758 RepID=UPI000F6E7810|nr:fimbrial protein [Pseudomonas orientalis]AZE95473.1 putative fimbrial protein [Pseudomonas orientalis]